MIGEAFARLLTRGRKKAPRAGKAFELLQQYKAALSNSQPPTTLLFGDSVYLRVSDTDEDRRPLDRMIADRLPGERVHATCHSAYTSYMFEVFLALAGRMNVQPRHVVIPFNLRCLSPQWDARPAWQYTQENAAVQAQLVDPAVPAATVVQVNDDSAAYRATAIASPLSQRRTLGDFRDVVSSVATNPAAADSRRREILVQHLGVPARRGHRQLGFLRATVLNAIELGAHAHVYVTPINIGLVQRLGGNALQEIIEENVSLVRSTCEEIGSDMHVQFDDWSQIFSPDHFFHENETTEHLQQRGRDALSALIAAGIQAFEHSSPTGGAFRT